MMACNCFDKVAEACDKQIRDVIGSDLAEMGESGFENAVWVMSAGDHAPVSLKYRFRYYRRRKNGEPETRQTKSDTAIMMRFCPFCGTAFSGSEVRDVPVRDGL